MSGRSRNDLVDRIRESATAVSHRTEIRPRVAVILGTGLGGLADELEAVSRKGSLQQDLVCFCRQSCLSNSMQCCFTNGDRSI
jgi:hypothetical protein